MEYDKIYAGDMAQKQHAALGAINQAAVGSKYANTITPLSPVVRLANAVDTAEQTAMMVHRLRVAMIGDVPTEPATQGKEYLGDGLIGRIADAASRIEAVSARILRDLEDMNRAAGDF